jgi:recombination associated protein RdgC
MGLVSGGLNARRFQITTPLPDGFRDIFLDNVRSYGFEELPRHASRIPQVGWVNLFDASDTAFELNSVLYDRYIALSMRVDKKTVNGKYMAIALAQREALALVARGGDELGKAERTELKDLVEEELLGKALPSVTTHDLVWDTSTGEVWVFATSEPVIDLFRGLVKDTFGAELERKRMVDRVRDRLSHDELIHRVETHLGASFARAEGDAVPKVDDPLEGHEFHLGCEFLTWLWQHGEATEGQFRWVDGAERGPARVADRRMVVDFEDAPTEIDEGEVTETLRPEQVTVWFDSKLTMVSIDDDANMERTTMVGVAPSASLEARRTLVEGKRPVEARLGLRRGDLECSFTIKATPQGVEIRSCKLPFEVKSGTDEKIYERMGLLELVDATMAQLFQQFFLLRTSPAWSDRLAGWLSDAAA